MAAAHLEAVTAAFAAGRAAELSERARELGSGRWPRIGEFVADELSVVLREQPFSVQMQLARSRRLASDLPSVWAAYRRGEVDPEQVRVIDRVARRVAEPSTLTAIDEQVVGAAQTRSPKQLRSWLLRLVVALEPLAFAARHRKALAERRVTVVQGVDGIGYVTGEVSAEDAADIDALLAAAARQLGASDPRCEQQRRSDLFADLLLGRVRIDDGELDDASVSEPVSDPQGAVARAWLEVEDIDPETGELLGVRRVAVDADGEPIDSGPEPQPTLTSIRRPRTVRIGVVVPLSSLLNAGDAPGELADRSGFVPAEVLRQAIGEAEAAGNQVLFTRLLTDDGGRLLDTTELGRFPSVRLAEAIRIRAGTCRFPTCSVPADRCDIDHHEPYPLGATAARNNDPECRRHHRAKTFAWLASVREDDAVEWTMPDANRYRCVDDPLPTGLAA